MGYAIELNLHRNSRIMVEKLWKTLSNENISSIMINLGVQPHISLMVIDKLDPELIRDDIRLFANSTKPISVKFSYVGTFPTSEGVIFIGIAMTPELSNLHANLHKQLEKRGIKSIEYYRPGNWIPHCTAAVEITSERLGTAMDICCKSDIFEFVILDEISVIEFRPTQNIYSYKLSS
jgi:2'-5' RNA ligase